MSNVFSQAKEHSSIRKQYRDLRNNLPAGQRDEIDAEYASMERWRWAKVAIVTVLALFIAGWYFWTL